VRTTRHQHQHTGKRAIAIKQLGPWQLVDFFLAQRDFLFSGMTALVSFHPPSVTGVAIQEAPFAPFFFFQTVSLSAAVIWWIAFPWPVSAVKWENLASNPVREEEEMVASHTHTLVESSSCACVCGCRAGPVVDVYWRFSAAQRTQHAMLKGERTWLFMQPPSPPMANWPRMESQWHVGLCHQLAFSRFSSSSWHFPC
jgi:hypothetical protein